MTPRERFYALSERQQAEILDKHRHYNIEHIEWWDAVYAEFKENMDKIGIDVHRMYFSGFWSQGDGACFYGQVSSWADFLGSLGYTCSALITLAEHAWNFRVTHQGHYYHENCTLFSCDMVSPDDYDDDVLGDFVDENSPYKTEIQNAAFVAILKGYDYSALYKEFEEAFKDHMRDLYSKLEAEYEGLTSDESVLEALDANDMLDEIIDELEDEYA